MDDSEAEVDYCNHRGESAELDAGLFSSTETALDLVRSSHLEGCYDIKHHSSTKTALRLQLAEEGAVASEEVAVASDVMRPYSPSSRLSSEPLHDQSRTDELYEGRARSEPSQEDHLPTSRSTSNEDELLSPMLVISTDTFTKENKQQQQQQQQEEEEEEEDNGDNENNEDEEEDGDRDYRQQEVDNIAAAQTAKRGRDPLKEDKSTLLAKRQRLLTSKVSF